MPGMNGVELQEHLGVQCKSVPIIFITAYPEERIREKICAAGAVALLSKPFDSSDMIEMIRRALRH